MVGGGWVKRNGSSRLYYWGGLRRSFGKGGMSLFLGVRGRMAAEDHPYNWETDWNEHFYLWWLFDKSKYGRSEDNWLVWGVRGVHLCFFFLLSLHGMSNSGKVIILCEIPAEDIGHKFSERSAHFLPVGRAWRKEKLWTEMKRRDQQVRSHNLALCRRSMLGLGSIAQRAQSVALTNYVKLNSRASINSAKSAVRASINSQLITRLARKCQENTGRKMWGWCFSQLIHNFGLDYKDQLRVHVLEVHTHSQSKLVLTVVSGHEEPEYWRQEKHQLASISQDD